MGSEKSVVIVSHTMLYGAPHALRDYLLKKKSDSLLFISLPFHEQRVASYTYYKNTKIEKEVSIKRVKSFGVFDYVIDSLQVIWWMCFQSNQFETFVGVNPINCAIGLFFKRTKRIKKVIFYSIDFTPKRFKNSLINFFYHKIEILCVIQADETWNVSPRIAEGREEFLGLSQKKNLQKVVPIGVWIEEIKKIPFEEVKKNQTIFLGHLLEKQGVQMVLEAIPLLIKKIPSFKFIILGGGEYEKFLIDLSKKLFIEKHVVFKGWVTNRGEIDFMLGQSAVAFATYKPEKDRLYNFSYYADPTKIKDYLASGLPVILTNVPYNAYELEKKKCGIVVEYTSKSIANAILKILNDEELLTQYKSNAIKFATQFNWVKIFDEALKI